MKRQRKLTDFLTRPSCSSVTIKEAGDLHTSVSSYDHHSSNRPDRPSCSTELDGCSPVPSDVDCEVSRSPCEIGSAAVVRQFPDDLGSIFEQPFQPRIKFPITVIGGKSRSFQEAWYSNTKWLEYSKKIDSAYCFSCRHFGSNSLADKTGKSPFIDAGGYCDWKHASGSSDGFRRDANCSAHIHSMTRWKDYRDNHTNRTGIDDLIDKVSAQVKEKNRTYLKVVCKILLLCAQQDLPLRGHLESLSKPNEGSDDLEGNSNPSNVNMGNFLALHSFAQELNSDFRSIVSQQPKNAKYTSSDVQNELLNIMAYDVINRIRQQIQAATCFSLIVDETKDESKNEQVSFVLRYINACGELCDGFVGFTQATNLDAKNLATCIENVIVNKMGLNMHKCICQCYDGASVMSGKCSGVQALLHKKYPTALYIHCCAHRLNLVLVECCKTMSTLHDIVAVLESLYVFMSQTTVHVLFLENQRRLNPTKQTIELKRLCDMRWACRYDSILAVHDKLTPIISTLDYIAEGENKIQAVTARVLLVQVTSLHFVSALVVCREIFCITRCLSDQLQAKDLDLSRCVALVDTVKSDLQNCKSNSADIITAAKDMAASISISELHVDEHPRRYGTVPKKLQDSLIMSTLGSSRVVKQNVSLSALVESLVSRTCQIILDELERRFSNLNCELFGAVEACSPASFKFLDVTTLQPLLNTYKSVLGFLPSEVELTQAKHVILQNLQKEPRSTLDVSVSLEMLKGLEAAFPNVCNMLRVARTFAVTSVSCERTFSTLKRVKTRLRSRMTENRLSSLCVLSVERKLSSLINIDSIVDTFKAKKRRIDL